jgi:DNA-binding NarL/FixJ family response regulator
MSDMTQPSPAPILLIDDHTLFRAGLRMVIGFSLNDVPVLEAGSLEEALHTAADALLVILLDIQLPGLNGIEAIPILKRRWPMAPVVVLSSSEESQTVAAAMLRGASGYVSKADSAADIVQVIERVLRGQAPGLTRHMPSAPESVAEAPHLTPRQCEVLDLLCQGLPNKVIGRRLGLSENTVRGHVQAILLFLDVSSRTEAVIKARQCGLVR